MTKAQKPRRSWAGLVVFVVYAVVWLAIAGVYVFPGARNWDSFEQLHQGLSGEYRTTFTIAYSWLLGRSFELTGTVGALWVMQLLFIFGCFLWLLDRARGRAAVVVVALVGLAFPPLWAGMVQHWRDTWVAAFVLFAFCGAVARSPVVVVVGGIAAYQFRSNAAALMLPMFMLAARDLVVPVLRQRFGVVSRWRRRFAVLAGAMVLVVMCTMTSSLIARALHAIPGFPIGPSLLFDLADLWRRSPDTTKHTRTPRALVKAARKAVGECDSHTVVDGTIPELEVKKLAAMQDALIADWWAAVKKHPDIWVKHKARAIECMLRIDYEPKPGYRYGYSLLGRGGHGLGRYDLRAEEAPLLKMQERFWTSWKPLFSPILWIVVFVIVSAAALKRCRPRAPVLALILGNVGYLLSNFLVAPSPNLRYLFPLLPSTLALALCAVAGAHLLRGRRSSRVSRPAPTPASEAASPPASPTASEPPTASESPPPLEPPSSEPA